MHNPEKIFNNFYKRKVIGLNNDESEINFIKNEKMNSVYEFNSSVASVKIALCDNDDYDLKQLSLPKRLEEGEDIPEKDMPIYNKWFQESINKILGFKFTQNLNDIDNKLLYDFDFDEFEDIWK